MTFRGWFACVVILNKAPKRRNWRRGKCEQRNAIKVFFFFTPFQAFGSFPKNRSLQRQPACGNKVQMT